MKKLSLNDVFKAAHFGCKQDTIRQYNYQLKNFATFIYLDKKTITRPNTHKAFTWMLENCNKGHASLIIKEYSAYLKHKKLSKTTINRYISAVTAIIEAAFEIGFINWIPPVIKPLKSSSVSKDTSGPGYEDVLKILEQAKKGWGMRNKRDPAILSLMFYMGLRTYEIWGLKYKDINLKEKTISILGKMRDDPETFFIPDACIPFLSYYLKHRDKRNNALFRTICKNKRTLKLSAMSRRDIYEMVSKVSEKAGVKTNPHALRHSSMSAATDFMGKKRLGVDYLLKFSRHKNLTELSRYLDDKPDHKPTIANLISPYEFPIMEDKETTLEAKTKVETSTITVDQFNSMMKQMAELNKKLSKSTS